ncbi:MAG: hypothetical protein JKX86_05645 [Verrucomicrobiales bacterium]|jgi:hypothetical protein|nr:hypothetical protein [Verrucomicrobiales bacterium]|tara:strand:+ start:509 stop:886 length:378 start_codon:yes stop_codon:yes gene_type:complete
MSGADIVALERDDPFPPAQVLDLAVSVAIGRDLAASEADMFRRIEDWFLRPATRAELKASVSRLIDRGWIHRSDNGDFDFCLTDAGVEAASTLSGGMIRMIDRGRGLLKTSFLLQSIDLEQGKCP